MTAAIFTLALDVRGGSRRVSPIWPTAAWCCSRPSPKARPSLWQWHYNGVLAGAREAAALGGQHLSQTELAKTRDGAWMALFTVGRLGPGQEGFRAQRLHRFDGCLAGGMSAWRTTRPGALSNGPSSRRRRARPATAALAAYDPAFGYRHPGELASARACGSAAQRHRCIAGPEGLRTAAVAGGKRQNRSVFPKKPKGPGVSTRAFGTFRKRSALDRIVHLELDRMRGCSTAYFKRARPARLFPVRIQITPRRGVLRGRSVCARWGCSSLPTNRCAFVHSAKNRRCCRRPAPE